MLVPCKIYVMRVFNACVLEMKPLPSRFILRISLLVFPSLHYCRRNATSLTAIKLVYIWARIKEIAVFSWLSNESLARMHSFLTFTFLSFFLPLSLLILLKSALTNISSLRHKAFRVLNNKLSQERKERSPRTCLSASNLYQLIFEPPATKRAAAKLKPRTLYRWSIIQLYKSS